MIVIINGRGLNFRTIWIMSGRRKNVKEEAIFEKGKRKKRTRKQVRHERKTSYVLYVRPLFFFLFGNLVPLL